MPNWAAPVVLAGMSRRGTGVPMSLKSLGALSATSVGGVNALAAWASAPNVAWRWLAAWLTRPLATVQVPGATPHWLAAAWTSIARAEAPARRIGPQASRTLDEPPVTCSESQ